MTTTAAPPPIIMPVPRLMKACRGTDRPVSNVNLRLDVL
jgi:hypothetical protein